MKNIYHILKEWKKECNCPGIVQFNYICTTGILTIYTPYPGYFIGKAGCYIEKYMEIFKKEFSGFNNIEFQMTDYYFV